MDNEIIVSPVSQFNDLWNDFTTVLRGKLRTALASKQLTPERAKSLLTETAMCWSADFEPEGRWVNGIVKDMPEKGTRIRKILVEDMTFEPEKVVETGYLPQIAGGIGGGALGYGIAALCGMGTIGTIATTIIPLGAGAVAGNVYADKKNRAAATALIDAYMAQLDSYRESVLALLNA